MGVVLIVDDRDQLFQLHRTISEKQRRIEYAVAEADRILLGGGSTGTKDDEPPHPNNTTNKEDDDKKKS